MKSKMTELEVIFAKQTEFMKMLGIPANCTLKHKEVQTKELLIACVSEISEILNETNWKPWRRISNPVDMQKVKDEIIDLFHFVIELAIVWNISASDLFLLYKLKMEKNIERQKEGY